MEENTVYECLYTNLRHLQATEEELECLVTTENTDKVAKMET